MLYIFLSQLRAIFFFVLSACRSRMALGASQAGGFLRFIFIREKQNIRGRFHILLFTLTLPKLGGVAIAVATRTKKVSLETSLQLLKPRELLIISKLMQAQQTRRLWVFRHENQRREIHYNIIVINNWNRVENQKKSPWDLPPNPSPNPSFPSYDLVPYI